ncbi:MAG: FAD-dependent oxidoreductase [Chloroflexi bacterium]|nr:FAD-dependent oxidoreductase [Chloroflexota bacterium]
MSAESVPHYVAAVIGAGPAGLFAARQLALQGVRVVIINRDVKPGGLAEYGIYPSKHKMKEGLRKQFRQIVQTAGIDYYGNLAVGTNTGLSLEDLKKAGFQALVVTVGAQGTKWLGLPGEELTQGVYHAKDIVYHYNRLPPFSQKQFAIGRRVALVGAGNVMLDIARWLIREKKVDEVIAVVRRGPAEVKFDKKEMEYVVANLDQAALDEEVGRVAPVMQAIGQDVDAAKAFILSALPKAHEAVSQSRFLFDFLASPTRILGDEQGNVCGLEIEETTLVPRDGDTAAKGTGVKRVLAADTVIFCIGDRVDETLGLPVQKGVFVKNTQPAFPMGGATHELLDPVTGQPIPGVFVAGWSREASSGLVGVARKDGESGAAAVLQYLHGQPPADAEAVVCAFKGLLANLPGPLVTKENILCLEAAEQAEAQRLGLEEFKFDRNEAMFAAMGL